MLTNISDDKIMPQHIKDSICGSQASDVSLCIVTLSCKVLPAGARLLWSPCVILIPIWAHVRRMLNVSAYLALTGNGLTRELGHACARCLQPCLPDSAIAVFADPIGLLVMLPNQRFD